MFYINYMEIQSFTDIITNSSSEIFIIKGKKEKNQEVIDLVYGIYGLLGRDIDEDINVYVASADYKDRGWGYKYKRGDIIIESVSDNSVPWAVVEFIENLHSVLDFISYGDVERHHLG